MGIFYFDESIHPTAGFILGAFVWYLADPSDQIQEALIKAGLRPGLDEFKSSARMDRNPRQVKARDELAIVVHAARIGVVIDRVEHRREFGLEALCGLSKITATNGLPRREQQAFFDEGLVPDAEAFKQKAAQLQLNECTLHIEQNSVGVLGLQVADLVAHTCATMLLAQMGLITKQIKAGDYSGYDPNEDIDLSFMLWAGLRRNFFAAPPPDPATWVSQLDFKVDVASRGLHISERCPPRLRDAALARFGSMYVGCVH
jgi:hypothetical protein